MSQIAQLNTAVTTSTATIIVAARTATRGMCIANKSVLTVGVVPVTLTGAPTFSPSDMRKVTTTEAPTFFVSSIQTTLIVTLAIVVNVTSMLNESVNLIVKDNASQTKNGSVAPIPYVTATGTMVVVCYLSVKAKYSMSRSGIDTALAVAVAPVLAMLG